MTSDCHVSFAFQSHYKFKRVVISRSVECLGFRIHHNDGVLFPFIGFDVKTNGIHFQLLTILITQSLELSAETCR